MRLPLLLVLAAAPALAAPMTAASDDVCALLRSDRHDRCRKLAHDGDATAYQSGTPELRRFVLAIARPGEDTLVSPSVDVHGDADAPLTTTTATLLETQLDGRPAIVLDVVSAYPSWQTEAFVGCGRDGDGNWRCSVVDAGRCAATGCDHALRLTPAR